MKTLACIVFLFASLAMTGASGIRLGYELAAAQTTDPKLSEVAHVKIRDIQFQQQTLRNQYIQLDQQLAFEVEAAYKEAGIKREDWTLNLETLKFSKTEKKAEIKK
jgi:hypothetical protein